MKKLSRIFSLLLVAAMLAAAALPALAALGAIIALLCGAFLIVTRKRA